VPIHDVGYRKWNGKKSSILYLWTIIARSGVQVVYRNIWVRRMLLVTWLPALYFGAGIFFFEQAVNNAEENGTSPQFAFSVVNTMLPPIMDRGPLQEAIEAETFDDSRQLIWGWLLASLMRYPQAFWVVLLVGLISPPLISRDVRTRAFLLYFSKPIKPADYILGKMMILCAFLAMISMLPVLGLYIFGVFLAPSWTIVFETWDFPVRIVLASAAFIIPSSALALMFSSLTTDAKYAAFSWFSVWVMGGFAWVLIQVAIFENSQSEIRSLSEQGKSIVIEDGKEVVVDANDWNLGTPMQVIDEVIRREREAGYQRNRPAPPPGTIIESQPNETQPNETQPNETQPNDEPSDADAPQPSGEHQDPEQEPASDGRGRVQETPQGNSGEGNPDRSEVTIHNGPRPYGPRTPGQPPFFRPDPGMDAWQQRRRQEDVAWELYLHRSKRNYCSLLSMYETLGRVQSWIFGVEKNFSVVLPSLIFLALQTCFSLLVLFRRVASPLRV